MNKPEDDAPATNADIDKFVTWYAGHRRIAPLDKDDMRVWWYNALRGVTVGELRNAARRLKAFKSDLVLAPHQVWALCKSKATERSIRKFNELRERITKPGSRSSEDKDTKRHQYSPEHSRAGENHD